MPRLLALLFTLAVLTGCATEPSQGAPRVPIITDQSAPVTVADPASIDIPAIGAKSTLIPLGLRADGTMEVPDVKQPLQAGWYQLGVKPGNVGPAVVAAHRDGNGQRGLFYRLSELDIGDPVRVTLQDGRTLTFRVYREQEVPKDSFPTQSVYQDTERAEIRLISCSGPFIGGSVGYSNNSITYAVLVEGN